MARRAFHWRGARLASALAALALGAARVAGAQDLQCDRGDTEVRRLTFTGNRTFSDALLANSIVATPSSWARRTLKVVGTRRCIDPIELQRDSLRVIQFYQIHGFSQVRVGLQVDTVAPSAVDITFRIREGTRPVVDRLTITGLDSIPAATRRQVVRDLPLGVGDGFDRVAVDSARFLLARRLRDNGYPTAEVLRSYAVADSTQRATVEYEAIPGPRARIGDVRVTIRPRATGEAVSLAPATVHRVSGLRTGGVYRERDLEAAKRNLYLTDAFAHVDLALDSASIATPGDSVIDVLVAVTEGFSRAARVQAGYGTLDCFRTQGSYTDYNFLNGLRRLDLSARVSKIGIGAPLDQARDLCRSLGLRGDPYSDTLNYYAGATVRQTTTFGRRLAPTVTLYSERRSEYKAFLRTTPIGAIASVTEQTRPRLPMTFAYQLEYGRTEAQPAIFCGVFNVCEVADRDVLLELRRLGVVSASATRDRTDNVINPSSGTILRVDLRHASTVVGSDPDLQFNKALADASWYQSIGFGHVLVARLRVGAVFGIGRDAPAGRRFIPLQERLYAGGPSSVRGFAQNELGPAVYITSGTEGYRVVPFGSDTFYQASPDSASFRAAPTGGNTVVVANVEARLRSPLYPDLVQFALFTDAGEVWNRGGGSRGIGFRTLKWTPGAGVRIFTPIGPVRVDVGYNPYDRPAGPAYFNAPVQGQLGLAPLYCVSPGNTLRVTNPRPPGTPPAGEVATQEAGTCPPAFVPRRAGGFFRRLTLHISIGQPF